MNLVGLCNLVFGNDCYELLIVSFGYEMSSNINTYSNNQVRIFQHSKKS